MQRYTAAVVQMNSQPNVDHNLEQAAKLISKAAEKGARVVALPENFAYLGDFDERMVEAETISQKAESFLKKIASKYEIYLLGGSFPVPTDNGKVFNRSLLLNPQGETVTQYDKIHLFDVDLDEGESYRESDYVEPGEVKSAIFFSEETGNIGLTICYDLRFPELYKKLSSEGAELLMVPSAFTQTTGEVHWEILLRARAIENTSYVIAPAQTGQHGPKRNTYGHAMIIDPWGTILAQAGSKPGVVMADINGAELNKVRAAIPSIKHRRV